jgi:hypothetical protein
VTIPPATLVLDNEAVQALGDVRHGKHRRALAFVEVVNQRHARRRQPISVLIPVAVRVETGWDRTSPGAAGLNRISRARDVSLDSHAANRAAQLRAAESVSVVDATVAQAAEAAEGPVVVITSDRADMQRLAALLRNDVRVVLL